MSSLLPSAPHLHYMAVMGRLPRSKLKEGDQVLGDEVLSMEMILSVVINISACRLMHGPEQEIPAGGAEEAVQGAPLRAETRFQSLIGNSLQADRRTYLSLYTSHLSSSSLFTCKDCLMLSRSSPGWVEFTGLQHQ